MSWMIASFSLATLWMLAGLALGCVVGWTVRQMVEQGQWRITDSQGNEIGRR